MKLQKIANIVTIVYFINLIVYSIISLSGFKEHETFFWFMRIPLLIVLYLFTSKKKNFTYISGLLLYQSASLLFTIQSEYCFLWASVCSALFKFCLVLLIWDLICTNNRLSVLIASIPVFIMYLYIVEFVDFSLGDSYYVWVVNALLTSLLSGVAIIIYLNDADQKSFWLLLSAILFVIQIGAFFTNKFYLRSEAIYQLVILTYGISHFCFFKFLVLKEKIELSS